MYILIVPVVKFQVFLDRFSEGAPVAVAVFVQQQLFRECNNNAEHTCTAYQLANACIHRIGTAMCITVKG